MKIRIEKGLPIATLELVYGSKIITFNNVLFDTGCAVSIFDTDLMAEIGLSLDFVEGIPTKMYGVGGYGEICNQQLVNGLSIDGQLLDSYELQLGMVSEMYGFDGLLGFDYMIKTGLSIEFSTLEAKYRKNN
jgi:hypothetical protein